MATPNQSRSIPVSKDIMYQARNKFPGYDDQQALTLYMLDQFGKQSETDNNQTRLINAQRSENEKLKNAVSSIGSELDQLERESVVNDNELQRLKDLTAKLRPASDLASKVSADEIKRVEGELEKLKSKPGMDEEKFNDLSTRVKELMNTPGVSAKDVKGIEKLINNLESQNRITTDLLKDTKEKLDAKEQRFASYIETKRQEIEGKSGQHAEEMKKYAEIIDQYKEKIKSLEKEIDPLRQEIEIVRNLRGAIQQDAETISDLVSFAKGAVGQDVAEPIEKETDANLVAQDATARAQAASRRRPSIPVNGENGRDLREPINPEEGPFMRESKIYEEVRVAKTYANKEYQEWMEEMLPLLVKEFKRKYRIELKNKDHLYSDQQIAYTIEEFAPWIWKVTSNENPVLSERQFSAFLTAVKIDLWGQPPEPEQYDLPLKEGLTKTYERMLDKIIGLNYL